MSSAVMAWKQISRAKHEAEASLANARTLRDQWTAAVGSNPTNLTQKDIDHLSKAFKNRLLSVKWDCEDLEELVGGEGVALRRSKQTSDLDEVRRFIDECKREVANFMTQLEEFELNKKLFTKHGFVVAPSGARANNTTEPTSPSSPLRDAAMSPAQATGSVDSETTTRSTATIIRNPLHNNPQYEKLLDDTTDLAPFGAASELNQDELHFDKSQLEAATAASANATIFSNALYEHYEADDQLAKGLGGSRVFNNLTRPNTDGDLFAGGNENEMILEMLETEYYNPPAGLLAKTKYNTTIRRMFDTDRKRFLGTIAFILSLPFLLMILIVM